MIPTDKMIAAERAFTATMQSLWAAGENNPRHVVTDMQYEQAMQQAAAEAGVECCWEWDDEGVPTWIDGEVAMWSDDVRWIVSRHAKVTA